jgi:hypothetical protein
VREDLDRIGCLRMHDCAEPIKAVQHSRGFKSNRRDRTALQKFRPQQYVKRFGGVGYFTGYEYARSDATPLAAMQLRSHHRRRIPKCECPRSIDYPFHARHTAVRVAIWEGGITTAPQECPPGTPCYRSARCVLCARLYIVRQSPQRNAQITTHTNNDHRIPQASQEAGKRVAK